jgi:hypothetical protein
MAPCLFRRKPGFFESRAAETILPTKTLGGYEDHLGSFNGSLIREGFGKLTSILVFNKIRFCPMATNIGRCLGGVLKLRCLEESGF